ncbi:hypothetical protein HZY91_03290 [Facklamia sp. DSM 111018]|uniref:GHMP kinase N-terminal domain-containing protein n=1 Tax=Facklamia lactis TaxID=2749967 RepID=A0ABS0LP27_9LACT|nr:hypothetical protein [Facklamia lactis]MBG9980114.1 hypothetical protein [Facklamia lactis]MBG9985916.1 hypothetical protein [Facklamia lactis]
MMNREKVFLKCKTPASCGEIVEGAIGTKAFLSAYPINCYSHITISKSSNGTRTPLPSKCQNLLKILSKEWGIPYQEIENLMIEIDSQIPVGKGMGSSTADLSGLAKSIACWFGLEVSDETIFQLCIQVEPTDNIIFNHLTLVDFLSGEIYGKYQAYPQFDLLCLESTEIISTVSYYQSSIYQQWMKDNYLKYQHLYDDYSQILSGPLRLSDLGELAIQSAKLNQHLRAKPLFKEILSIRKTKGIKGINIAHSGSVIAIWYDPALQTSLSLTKMLKEIDGLTDTYQINHYKTVKGGSEIKWIE